MIDLFIDKLVFECIIREFSLFQIRETLMRVNLKKLKLKFNLKLFHLDNLIAYSLLQWSKVVPL